MGKEYSCVRSDHFLGNQKKFRRKAKVKAKLASLTAVQRGKWSISDQENESTQGTWKSVVQCDWNMMQIWGHCGHKG